MNAIVTPTFEAHFKYISKYLRSAVNYIEDKCSIRFYFVISAKEKYTFKKIIAPYENQLQIVILYFEELLENANVSETPDKILKKYGKYSFQTLKKFYAMLAIEEEHILILDSESMWVKNTNMENLFNDYFENPYIAGSVIDSWIQSPFNKNVNDNVAFLLNSTPKLWFLENFVWFYEKKILNKMFSEIGSPYEITVKVDKYIRSKKLNLDSGIGIFEIILYQNYIYKHANEFGYKIININELCKATLGDELYAQYLEDWFLFYKGNCGLLERTSMLLRPENVKLLAKMFKENKFNIIRFDNRMSKYHLQRQFFQRAKPNILAASQDHLFGLNYTCTNIFTNYLHAIKCIFKNKLLDLHAVQTYLRRKEIANRIICLDVHVFELLEEIQRIRQIQEQAKDDIK